MEGGRVNKQPQPLTTEEEAILRVEFARDSLIEEYARDEVERIWATLDVERERTKALERVVEAVEHGEKASREAPQQRVGEILRHYFETVSPEQFRRDVRMYTPHLEGEEAPE